MLLKKIKYSMKKILKKIFPIILIIAMILMIINSAQCAESFLQGLKLWGLTVLPCTLPFLFLSNLVSYSMDFNRKDNKKILGINPVYIYVFTFSLLSGYPVGAKLTADCYQDETIDNNQAQTIATLSSVGSSTFIISVIGNCLFLNIKIGIIIYLSHILSCLICTLIIRNFFKSSYYKKSPVKTEKSNVLYDCIFKSVQTSLIIGGFICVFSVLIKTLNIIGFFNFFAKIFSFISDKEHVKSFLICLLESSNGVKAVSALGSSVTNIAICSFAISFGGLCVICQSVSFLEKCKIKKGVFIAFKLLHGLISLILTLIFLKIFL